MVKALLLPLISLFSFTLAKPWAEQPDYRSFLKTEENERGNQTVVGISSAYDHISDLRVYSFDGEIDEISDTAFKDSGIDSFVLSREVTLVSDAALEGIEKVYFTGSIEEFEALGLSYSASKVQPYSVDEGFIYYWNTVVRPVDSINICDDVSYETFGSKIGLYE